MHANRRVSLLGLMSAAAVTIACSSDKKSEPAGRGGSVAGANAMMRAGAAGHGATGTGASAGSGATGLVGGGGSAGADSTTAGATAIIPPGGAAGYGARDSSPIAGSG